MFKKVFYRLCSDSPNAWAQTSDRHVSLHRTVVAQFFLDCFLSVQNLMSLLLSPVRQKDWVDLHAFMQSFELIQQITYEPSSFFFREPNNDLKKKFTIQKLICKALHSLFLGGHAGVQQQT